MARHFASAALLIELILAVIRISRMSKTPKTKWMAAAFKMLPMKHPEHCNQWILDDKWIDIILTNCFTSPSKEKEKELKSDWQNMVKAVSSQWKHTKEDFTRTNQRGTFWHIHCVNSTTVNDKGDTERKKTNSRLFHAGKPGKDCPTKPRVAEVFKDKDEMDNHINCLKKRKQPKMKSTNKFALGSTCL
jgi:hypothetical protein